MRISDWSSEVCSSDLGKKLKPIVFEDLIRIAELDPGTEPGAGFEPVAFMITLPDLNELTRDFDGRLFPFNWAKLLWRLRSTKVKTMRVPLKIGERRGGTECVSTCRSRW